MPQSETLTIHARRTPPLTPNSRDFPDPYDMVVGTKNLTIEFYGYQGAVNFINMENCVNDANRDAMQKIFTDQKNTPLGTELYVWSSGNVALYLSPGEQLNWHRWSLVPVTIGRFIAENGLRGTQFTILCHGLGPVGYGQLVAASEMQTPITTTATTTTNAFPDPYDKDFQSVGLTIEFYGYQGSISPNAMRDCISVASNDVVRHLLVSEAAMNMDDPSYSYSAGGVNLFLSPTEHLTWHMWAFVPIWIQEFVTENEFKGTQFILLWEGFGPVGYGQLTDTSTNTLYTPKVGSSDRHSGTVG